MPSESVIIGPGGGVWRTYGAVDGIFWRHDGEVNIKGAAMVKALVDSLIEEFGW